MIYAECIKAIFLERPNRFIAHVLLNGVQETVHVKNTGRCRELLVRGREVILAVSDNPLRKAKYDLVAVWRDGILINMDSQAPNHAVGEWLREGGLLPNPKLVKAETSFGHSRFDFYLETENQTHFIEVKGVTLERDGIAYFPDAPTERGRKHIYELVEAKKAGHEAWIVFLVQMAGAKEFRPNRSTDEAFANALTFAREAGVHILAYDASVTENAIFVGTPISVII